MNFYLERTGIFELPLTIPLNKEEVIVGRNDLHILKNACRVSPTHASFQKSSDGQWFIKDLSKVHGIYVKEVKIPKGKLHLLCVGDSIGLGVPHGFSEKDFEFVLCQKLEAGNSESATLLNDTAETTEFSEDASAFQTQERDLIHSDFSRCKNIKLKMVNSKTPRKRRRRKAKKARITQKRSYSRRKQNNLQKCEVVTSQLFNLKMCQVNLHRCDSPTFFIPKSIKHPFKKVTKTRCNGKNFCAANASGTSNFQYRKKKVEIEEVIVLSSDEEITYEKKYQRKKSLARKMDAINETVCVSSQDNFNCNGDINSVLSEPMKKERFFLNGKESSITKRKTSENKLKHSLKSSLTLKFEANINEYKSKQNENQLLSHSQEAEIISDGNCIELKSPEEFQNAFIVTSETSNCDELSDSDWKCILEDLSKDNSEINLKANMNKISNVELPNLKLKKGSVSNCSNNFLPITKNSNLKENVQSIHMIKKDDMNLKSNILYNNENWGRVVDKYSELPLNIESDKLNQEMSSTSEDENVLVNGNKSSAYNSMLLNMTLDKFANQEKNSGNITQVKGLSLVQQSQHQNDCEEKKTLEPLDKSNKLNKMEQIPKYQGNSAKWQKSKNPDLKVSTYRNKSFIHIPTENKQNCKKLNAEQDFRDIVNQSRGKRSKLKRIVHVLSRRRSSSDENKNTHEGRQSNKCELSKNKKPCIIKNIIPKTSSQSIKNYKIPKKINSAPDKKSNVRKTETVCYRNEEVRNQQRNGKVFNSYNERKKNSHPPFKASSFNHNCRQEEPLIKNEIRDPLLVRNNCWENRKLCDFPKKEQYKMHGYLTCKIAPKNFHPKEKEVFEVPMDVCESSENGNILYVAPEKASESLLNIRQYSIGEIVPKAVCSSPGSKSTLHDCTSDNLKNDPVYVTSENIKQVLSREINNYAESEMIDYAALRKVLADPRCSVRNMDPVMPINLNDHSGSEQSSTDFGSPVTSSEDPRHMKLTVDHMPPPPPVYTKLTAKITVDTILLQMLSWNVLWLKEQKCSSHPPPVTEVVRKLMLSYDTFDDYVASYYPLLMLETWDLIFKAWSEAGTYNEVFFIVTDCVEDNDIFILRCESVFSSVEMTQFHAPKEGKLLTIELREQDKVSKVFGYISKHTVEKVKLEQEVLHPELQKLPSAKANNALLMKFSIKLKKKEIVLHFNKVMKAQIVYYLKPQLHIIKSLLNLPSSPLIRDILKPRDSNCRIFPQIGTNLDVIGSYSESQKAAIVGICNAVMRPYVFPQISLLQGPPGTGKTHVIIGIIQHLLNSKNSVEVKLFVTAPSDAAVDEIGLHLKDVRKKQSETNKRKMKFVRIGQYDRIHQEIKCFSLDALAEKNIDNYKRDEKMRNQLILDIDVKISSIELEIESMKYSNLPLHEINQARSKLAKYCHLQSKYKEEKATAQLKLLNFIDAKNGSAKVKLLRDADVILSTLSGCRGKDFETAFSKSGHSYFTCCIVDEAAQCTEPEVLQPLAFGMSKLILVGDKRQLSATVHSRTALENNFHISLSERIHSFFLASGYTSPVLMLTEQYRMHSEICSFPSLQFYSNQLTTPKEVDDKCTLFPVRPYSIFDISLSQETSVSAVFNPEEEIIINICRRLMLVLPADCSIGVITPCQKQKDVYQKVFSGSNDCKRIEVNTVDGFQGRERDVIILSCVRTYFDKVGKGFLVHKQKLNVAITRASKCLIICGNMEALQEDMNWKSLIKNAKDRTLCVQITSVDGIPFAIRDIKKR